MRDVRDYLDDEPIPACDINIVEADAPDRPKAPRRYRYRLDSLHQDAVRAGIELIDGLDDN